MSLPTSKPHLDFVWNGSGGNNVMLWSLKRLLYKVSTLHTDRIRRIKTQYNFQMTIFEAKLRLWWVDTDIAQKTTSWWRLMFGDRTFSVAAPTLWSSFSAMIRNAPSLDTLKKLLKTLQFTGVRYQASIAIIVFCTWFVLFWLFITFSHSL